MKDTIAVQIGENHLFDCDTNIISRVGENNTTQLNITLDSDFSGYWAFLEFETSKGDKFTTPNLDIVANKISYDIPAGVVDAEGNLSVQLVLEKNGDIWKTNIKEFYVKKSIDAVDDIPDKMDFLAEAQAKLDAISAEAISTTTKLYVDTLPETAEASENDIRVNILFSGYEGKVIRVKPNPNRKTSPLICGRQYLLDKNTSVHSSSGVSGGTCLPIAVIDPDTGAIVNSGATHYNPYFVPMNHSGEMSLYIQDGVAIWLNPPFFYCIDADPYLGKNLTPYADVDWKCKITRGNGWASIQGVCEISGKLDPATAGERDIIKVGLPFRPITHKLIKGCCTRLNSASTAESGWEVCVDKVDGSVWVKRGTAVTGTQYFVIDLMYPVTKVDQSIID